VFDGARRAPSVSAVYTPCAEEPPLAGTLRGVETLPHPIPVVTSDAHLAHAGLVEVMGGRPVACYEKPERITAIQAALSAAGVGRFVAPTEHGAAPITALHDPDLLDLLEHAWADALASGATDGTRPLIPDTFLVGPYAAGGYTGAGTARPARLGAHCLDTATPIVAGTYGAARAAVDVALTAADEVVAGAPTAYALCRPPGHHASRDMYGGYCFFNNAAIVADRLVREGASRVAVLDLDYHHGNGTQQLFWDRGEILYVSLHADPVRAFPYFSGHADERGAGAGRGATRNFPLPARTRGAAYLRTLDDACSVVAAYAPDAPLVISLGFDAFDGDPICDLALATADFAAIGGRVRGLGLPAIVVQEGGYAIDAIGANAVAFLRGVTGA
jgi:acetoin utilization deacetylase AcuC-like enzyme